MQGAFLAMDADGYAAFKQSGNVFDPVLAARLRSEVLLRGNSRDPAESYTAFRGRMPNADARFERSSGIRTITNSARSRLGWPARALGQGTSDGGGSRHHCREYEHVVHWSAGAGPSGSGADGLQWACNALAARPSILFEDLRPGRRGPIRSSPESL